MFEWWSAKLTAICALEKKKRETTQYFVHCIVVPGYASLVMPMMIQRQKMLKRIEMRSSGSEIATFRRFAGRWMRWPSISNAQCLWMSLDVFEFFGCLLCMSLDVVWCLSIFLMSFDGWGHQAFLTHNAWQPNQSSLNRILYLQMTWIFLLSHFIAQDQFFHTWNFVRGTNEKKYLGYEIKIRPASSRWGRSLRRRTTRSTRGRRGVPTMEMVLTKMRCEMFF